MIGQGTTIWRSDLSNIHEKAIIGKGCRLHCFLWIGETVRIGDYCYLEAGAFLPNGVIVGDRVFIGPYVIFTNDKYPPSPHWEDTIVEDDVSIGAGAVILPGLKLGKGCRIGTGSVVTKNVPSGETWVGNPAKPIRQSNGHVDINEKSFQVTDHGET